MPRGALNVNTANQQLQQEYTFYVTYNYTLDLMRWITYGHGQTKEERPWERGWINFFPTGHKSFHLRC